MTPTEWHIVEVLVRNPGRLVSQRQLLQEVWGPQYEKETNYLRVFLAQIRKKLEPDPARPRYFLTEARMGYRFVALGSASRRTMMTWPSRTVPDGDPPPHRRAAGPRGRRARRPARPSVDAESRAASRRSGAPGG